MTTQPTNPNNRQFVFIANKNQPVGTFRQIFSEKLTFTFDYSEWLADLETILSVFFTVFPASAPALAITGAVISTDGKQISFQTEGGVDGVRYQLYCNITTSNKQNKSDQFFVDVLEYLQGECCDPTYPANASTITEQLLAAAASAETSAQNSADSAAQAAAYAYGKVWNGVGLPSGVTAPTASDGDYYIDTSTGAFYGPRENNVWPTTAIMLPSNIITGVSYSTAPANTVGVDKNYFLDTASGYVYGPKANGVWPGIPVYIPPTTQADNSHVLKSGDTMTGPLQINMLNPVLVLNATTADNAVLRGQSIAKTRWDVALGNTEVETGANSGSNFEVTNYNDAGVKIGSVFKINRASATVEFQKTSFAQPAEFKAGLMVDSIPSPSIYLNKALNDASSANDLFGLLAGKNRWAMSLGNNTVETGGNSGSDFKLYRYSDAGTLLDTPVSVDRASGLVTLRNQLQVQAANPAIYINKQDPAQNANLLGLSRGLTRWDLSLGNASTETGANAGSDFTLYRFTDAGAFLGDSLTIYRKTGNASFSGDITGYGSASFASVLTAQYLTINANATIGGALQVGSASVSSVLTASYLTVNASATIAGALQVGPVYSSGASSFTGSVSVQAGGNLLYLDETQGDAHQILLQSNTTMVAYLGATPQYCFYLRDGNYNPRCYVESATGNMGLYGQYLSGSDISLKSNIAPLSGVLEKLKQLTGVGYTQVNGQRSRIGLVAQEVQKVFPQVVAAGPDGNLGVAYGDLVAVLIEAVKALSLKVEALEARA